MSLSRSLTFIFLIALVALPTTPAAAKAAPAIAGGYKGAIIMDAATGHVLFEDNADEISPPASMTKLMTFAVVTDKLRSGALTLQTPVRISVADSKIGGTQVFLDPRETFPVEELIYAMMIQSANDAAHALSRAAAGSPDAFVELMNAKARELGMTHTTFRTPHGLPPSNRKIAEGDLTTPRDFALLSRYLLLKTDVLKYTSVRRRPFGSPPRLQPIDMVNHDNLLGRVAGVDGLKTGFTNGAGFCLSATALRNNHRIIVVTMGGASIKARDLKVEELLDRGFAALPPGAPTFASQAPAASPAAENLQGSPLTPVPTTPELKKATDAPESSDGPVIKLVVPGAKK
jgi:D-alanyl-D-alanine carboxypeptidase (penicillin-binding protein 5/6)